MPGTGSGKRQRQQRRRPPPGKVAGSGAAAGGRVGAGSGMGRPREGGESIHPSARQSICPSVCAGPAAVRGGRCRCPHHALPPPGPRSRGGGVAACGSRTRLRARARPGGAAESPGGAGCGASPPRPAALPGAFRAGFRASAEVEGGRGPPSCRPGLCLPAVRLLGRRVRDLASRDKPLGAGEGRGRSPARRAALWLPKLALQGARALFVREAPRWCEYSADGALPAHAVLNKLLCVWAHPAGQHGRACRSDGKESCCEHRASGFLFRRLSRW